MGLLERGGVPTLGLRGAAELVMVTFVLFELNNSSAIPIVADRARREVGNGVKRLRYRATQCRAQLSASCKGVRSFQVIDFEYQEGMRVCVCVGGRCGS